MEFEEIKQEVMRKIGRNLLLCQQMEHMLKFLIVHGDFEGSLERVKAEERRRTASVRTESMGDLIKRFQKPPKTARQQDVQEEGSVPTIRMSLAVNFNDDSVPNTRKHAMNRIVEARNGLVHRLLPRLDPQSVDSWIETERFLDRQRDDILPEISTLASMVDAIERGRKEFAEILRAEETRSQFKAWLRYDELVIWLNEIADQKARPDGWTLLNIAGQLIREHAPEVLAKIQSDGHKTLKRLVQATELFDIVEEPTGKGVRVLYKMKEGWKIERS